MPCHDEIQNWVARLRFDRRSIAVFVMALTLLSQGLAADISLPREQETPVIVKTLSGESLEGLILAIEGASLLVRAGEETRKLDFDELSSVEFGVTAVSPSERAALIELTDGSVLNTRNLSIESGKLEIGLSCGGKLEVSSRNVQSVRFKTYENQLDLSKQWQEIIADDSRKSDAIIITRNLELATVEGIVGDISDDKLGFSIDERSARVAVDKLDAILFYHASGREMSTPVCEIVLADNSRLLAGKLEWNLPLLRASLVSGALVEIPVVKVASVRFSLGKELFLSSTKPSTNDWMPLITSSAILEKLRKMNLARVNRSFSGKPLSLRFESEQPLFRSTSGLSLSSEVRQFENGFAIQGGGKLAFALNGKYERLTGLVGFDPDANASGNVSLNVVVDGKTAIDKELIHQFMNNPIEIDLNVKDVERVVFQVNYNDGRSTGDQIHLVELKVSQ